ncbi:MAG: uroporphyrinogen-III C-methyltransferase [Immundisolibacteraceae bacterium]|nr:uroporphyrinogen-III C-methyltransferase [Immundisolibacteraceae bacterium]
MDNQPETSPASTADMASDHLDVKAAAENGNSASKPKRGLLKFLLLLLLVAAVATSWVFQAQLQSWFQAQGFFQGEIRLTQLEQKLRQTDQQFQRLEEQLSVNRERLVQAQQLVSQLDRLNESVGAVDLRVERIELGLKRQQASVQLLAVRQLLFVADQQLRLVNDRSLALQALGQADNILNAVDDRQWLPLRALIATQISALQAIPAIDVSGINLRLTELRHRIDELSGLSEGRLQPQAVFADSAAMAELEVDDWRQFFSRGWHRLVERLSSLVSIQRVSGEDPVLITAEQLQGLKFNLQAQLLLAELDLARASGDVVQRLNEVVLALEKYFDQTSPAVAAMLVELDLLSKTPVKVEYPDISAPLLWLDTQLAAGVR